MKSVQKQQRQRQSLQPQRHRSIAERIELGKTTLQLQIVQQHQQQHHHQLCRQ